MNCPFNFVLLFQNTQIQFYLGFMKLIVGIINKSLYCFNIDKSMKAKPYR